MGQKSDLTNVDVDRATAIALYETHRFCIRLSPNVSLVDEHGTPKDDIDANKADVTLIMTEKIPTKLLPKVGDTISFVGSAVSYGKDPSFMMTLDKGTMAMKKAEPAAKKPVHHAPARKKH